MLCIFFCVKNSFITYILGHYIVEIMYIVCNPGDLLELYGIKMETTD